MSWKAWFMFRVWNQMERNDYGSKRRAIGLRWRGYTLKFTSPWVPV